MRGHESGIKFENMYTLRKKSNAGRKKPPSSHLEKVKVPNAMSQQPQANPVLNHVQ